MKSSKEPATVGDGKNKCMECMAADGNAMNECATLVKNGVNERAAIVRYKSADILRAAALLLVMIYHSWVTLEYPAIQNQVLVLVVKLGGEIGVTTFFVLSGFGIFHSLERNQNRNGKINYHQYILGRLRRIIPNYYAALLIALSLTGSAAYLSRAGIKDLITHVLFLHNLFPSTHGSIFGVLWTMGVIVQFYALAPLLYKAVKRSPLGTLASAVTISIFLKFLLFNRLLPGQDAPQTWYFIYSRQLFTALDNFVAGMFAAWLCTKYHFRKKLIICEVFAAGLVLVWCKMGDTLGIYTDNVSGYVWHSGLALGLALILFLSASSGRNYGKVWKPVLWLAANEYGIYIWHLSIMQNILQYSENLQALKNQGRWLLVMAVQIVLPIVTGCLISKAVDALAEAKRHS